MSSHVHDGTLLQPAPAYDSGRNKLVFKLQTPVTSTSMAMSDNSWLDTCDQLSRDVAGGCGDADGTGKMVRGNAHCT